MVSFNTPNQKCAYVKYPEHHHFPNIVRLFWHLRKVGHCLPKIYIQFVTNVQYFVTKKPKNSESLSVQLVNSNVVLYVHCNCITKIEKNLLHLASKMNFKIYLFCVLFGIASARFVHISIQIIIIIFIEYTQ